MIPSALDPKVDQNNRALTHDEQRQRIRELAASRVDDWTITALTGWSINDVRRAIACDARREM